MHRVTGLRGHGLMDGVHQLVKVISWPREIVKKETEVQKFHRIQVDQPGSTLYGCREQSNLSYMRHQR